jgi:mannitol-1-/sugar-/sorbitol-6-phosphatase
MKRLDCHAILFDLDGVLVDSTAYIERQWRRWAKSKGLAEEPFLRVCHGRRAIETIRLAAPHLDAEAEVAAFVPDDSGDGLGIRASPGAQRLLQDLPAGSWAVATSGTRQMARERLHSADLPVPAVLVCAEDVRCGKPSPDVYLLAATRLGVSPRECLVVEDAPAGIQAARAAGIRVVAVTTTHPLEELPADLCIRALTDIHLGRTERPLRGPHHLELLISTQ